MEETFSLGIVVYSFISIIFLLILYSHHNNPRAKFVFDSIRNDATEIL